MNEMARRFLPPAEDAGAAPRGVRPTGPFGVLDIGTTKVVCIIGRIESDGSSRVLGFGWQRGRGVRSGGIVDLDDAERAIRAAVGQAENDADQRLKRDHRQPLLRPAGEPAVQRAMAGRRPRGDRGRSAPRAAGRPRPRGHRGRDIIHSLPLAFAADDAQGVEDPRGLYCETLTARLHVVDALSHRAAATSAAAWPLRPGGRGTGLGADGGGPGHAGRGREANSARP